MRSQATTATMDRDCARLAGWLIHHAVEARFGHSASAQRESRRPISLRRARLQLRVAALQAGLRQGAVVNSLPLSLSLLASRFLLSRSGQDAAWVDVGAPALWWRKWWPLLGNDSPREEVRASTGRRMRRRGEEALVPSARLQLRWRGMLTSDEATRTGRQRQWPAQPHVLLPRIKAARHRAQSQPLFRERERERAKRGGQQ
jgi:hypothetical protein